MNSFAEIGRRLGRAGLMMRAALPSALRLVGQFAAERERIFETARAAGLSDDVIAEIAADVDERMKRSLHGIEYWHQVLTRELLHRAMTDEIRSELTDRFDRRMWSEKADDA